MNTYIGARYVPIFGRKDESTVEWDNSAPYEPLTVVIYQGNSYTSRQYVPAGVAITNTDYWVETGNYNAQVEYYRNEVAQYEQTVSGKAEQTDLNALSAKLPAAQFTSTNTVKKYVDDSISTAVTNEAGLRIQADDSLNSQINTLSLKLPSSQFPGTVKQYIDDGLQGKATTAQLTALSDKLPASAFGSTTVKQYIDNAVSQQHGVSSLRDRKIVCVGDSLTYSASHHADTYWPEFLHDLYGCETHRFAHGGTGFVATTSSSPKTFKMDLEDAVADTSFSNSSITDVIIIGGLNDYNQNSTAVTNAILDCISYARTNFVNAVVRVGFCLCGVKPLGQIHAESLTLLGYMNHAARVGGACIIETPWTWINQPGHDYGDGIHVTTAGQRTIAGCMASHLCGGTTRNIAIYSINFASEFNALLTGSSNSVMCVNDGVETRIVCRGQFNSAATMPSGNVSMFTVPEEFRSGVATSSRQIMTPLNVDAGAVMSDDYVVYPRAYYNGGATVNAQYLHRMYLQAGSGLFGFEMAWPQGM